MSFAGLWERNDRLGVESFTIVTTRAAPAIAQIHNRMPVIVGEAEYDAWMSPDTAAEEALAMLQPYASELVTYPVSRFVSNSRNEGPACVACANA